MEKVVRVYERYHLSRAPFFNSRHRAAATLERAQLCGGELGLCQWRYGMREQGAPPLITAADGGEKSRQ